MTASRKITITVAGTVTAVLAAGGIAMATPAATDLPSTVTGNPATAMMDGQFEPVAGGDGPQASWMNQMHAGDLDSIAELHAEVWADGDMDAMYGQMGAMRSEMGAMNGQMGAMHSDAEQMRAHHDQVVERDPQMRQLHDEMADRYPEMREHLDSVGGPAGPRR